MTLYYKDKNGRQLIASAPYLLFGECTSVTISVVYDDGIGRPAKKKIITESDGRRYFVWDNTKIYIGEFWSVKIQNITDYCKGTNIDDALLMASIIKYRKFIGLVAKAKPYSAALPSIPTELFDTENPCDMLYVPFLTHNDLENSTIQFAPNNRELWRRFSNLTFKMEDLICSIRNDAVEIVLKNDFVKTYTNNENEFDNLSNFKKRRYLKRNGEFRKVIL